MYFSTTVGLVGLISVFELLIRRCRLVFSSLPYMHLCNYIFAQSYKGAGRYYSQPQLSIAHHSLLFFSGFKVNKSLPSVEDAIQIKFFDKIDGTRMPRSPYVGS